MNEEDKKKLQEVADLAFNKNKTEVIKDLICKSFIYFKNVSGKDEILNYKFHLILSESNGTTKEMIEFVKSRKLTCQDYFLSLIRSL